jgi:RNA polymerase-binding protein DksA
MLLSVCYRPAPMSAAKKSSSSKSKAAKPSSARGSTTRKTTAKKAVPNRPRGAGAATKTAAKKPAKRTVKKAATRKTAKKPAAKTVKKSTAGGSTGAAASSGRRTGARAADKPAGRATRGRAARPLKLNAGARERIRAQLVQERANYEAEMAELEEESFHGTQSELTGEVGIDEDFADAGSATFDREQALSIQNNVRDLIDQVDRALARLEEGTYGQCERCGRPIDAARLKALPRTLLCTDCKRREERSR